MKRIVFFLQVWFLCGCSFLNAQEILDNISTNYTGVESIQVKGLFCEVSVGPGVGEMVQLIGEIRGVRRVDEYKIKAQQNGSVLEVWLEHPRTMHGSVKGFLDFQVPKGVILKVDNISGNVKVNGVGRDEIWLKSISGNIKASGIPCDLKASSVSGNVVVSVIDGSVEARSISGMLQVSNVKGTLTGGTASGTVKVEMVEGAIAVETTSGDCFLNNVMKSASVKSASGNVRVSEIKGDLKGNTISGDIYLEDAVGSFDLETLSGNQKGSEVMLSGSSRFHSLSGDIILAFSNPQGVLSYRLTTSSGSLNAAGTSGDKKLEIGNGPIVVTGHTASGDQNYK